MKTIPEEDTHPERYNMACAILEHTNDGDDLLPVELKVVELAVNDDLNAAGWEKFGQIYKGRVVDKEEGVKSNE